MSRLSLNDWYRYLESQFEKADATTPEPSEKHTAELSALAAHEAPSPAMVESAAPAALPAESEKGRAVISIRVPHFAEFVPLREPHGHAPQPAETPLPSSEPTAVQEPSSDGPRLRKRAGRQKRAPESLVPPEADEVWAKLPRYLRYLAEWTDDRVTRKYYPVRGRSETRAELIARLTDPVLTLEETARLLGVCPATVRRYTDRGWLRCFRTEGNQRRFKLSDIVAFLEEQALRQPRGNRHNPDDETAP